MDLLVDLHSVFRWVVLLVALAAIAFAVLAATGARPWDRVAERLSFFFPLTMDIQALIGLVVWVLGSGWAGDTFLGWIHPGLMLAAIGLAHVGRARSEKAEGSKAKGRQATLFFDLSLLMVLVAIPTASWPL
ncbi:MAG: hypothetical protein ABIO92_09485 [Chloroflexia bacterium]